MVRVARGDRLLQENESGHDHFLAHFEEATRLSPLPPGREGFGMSSSLLFASGTAPSFSSAGSTSNFIDSSGFQLARSFSSYSRAASYTDNSMFASSSRPRGSTGLLGFHPATTTISGSGFGTPTSPSIRFSSTDSSSLLAFGSSSIGSPSGSFMFTSRDSFSAPFPAISQPFSSLSTSPTNDQMDVEYSTSENTVKASNVPSGMAHVPSPALTPSTFTFGSPAAPSGGAPTFHFGGQQNPLTFVGAPTGSYSLGAGGTSKSHRRVVKVRRDKCRRK